MTFPKTILIVALWYDAVAKPRGWSATLKTSAGAEMNPRGK